jgi:SAM-dependent methyltransferase
MRGRNMKYFRDLIKRGIKKIVSQKMAFVWRRCANILCLRNRFVCPCCGGHFRKMKSYEESFYIKGKLIDHYTENAICPACGSDIRHRFLFTFLENNTDILTTHLRLLHFAPEKGISCFFKKQRNIDYVPCDINPSNYSGAIKIDITNIQFPDNSFDCILATHVLEHIKDDKRAIKEIYRVLKPGGWALVVIPIYGEKTFEDHDLDYSGREKMYGMGDHMRMNGLDFRVKLVDAGFHVDILSLDDVPGKYIDRSIRSPHVDSDKYLFFATK